VGNGAFTLDGTIRKEWRHYDVNLPSLFGAAGPQELDGGATAASVRGAYRIGRTTGFAAMPFVGFSYADSDIDDLRFDASSAYAPGRDKTKIGEAGLRLSYRTASDAGVTFEPFASAAALRNWSRGDEGTFGFGTPASSFTLDSVTWKDAMRYSVGLIGSAANGRVSTFVIGNWKRGSDIHGFAVNGGIRFNF
jgi:outer membrane autotransporter protein